MDGDSPPGQFESQFVGDADGLQQRANLMIAVRPLAQNLERPVYFGKGWKSERHSISVMRRLQSLSWVFELASQPCNLIGLDRIFEGLLPLSAGIGQAP